MVNFVVATLIGLIAGFLLAYILKKFFFASYHREAENKLKEAEREREKILKEAEREAARLKREGALEAREKFLKYKSSFEREMRGRQEKIEREERRLLKKEESLKSREEVLRERERQLRRKEQEIDQKYSQIKEKEEKASQLMEEAEKKLEEVAEMTREEARAEIMQKVEESLRHEKARLIRDFEKEIESEKAKISKEVIARAIQTSAADTVVESTVTVVELPSDDMKGRIIGREGRNIRALEMATEVDFIVDDTPEAVILSSFDPLKREIAKMAVERLVADGRIHPARIEEVVEKVKSEIEERIREIGKEVVVELGIKDLHPELEYYIGKLKFRTSFGQNALAHSKEVALLAAHMAREIGANVEVSLRAGLLHDVGKAIDRDYNQSHVELSVMLARKYGESEEVIAAIASHHDEVNFPSVEAVLVQAADTLSAARPGARRELLEHYIKRIETLEKIASEYSGVTKAFALQAGREIRVIVNSEKISDDDAYILSYELARRIEKELTYPGQIKVTVIREVRAVEYSK
ncbi:MAG: ribonuclease Y [Candidatus Aminicenantes bacterium]|nr:ribonuclease Y [Candidatus Aminicenantes bacterium]